MPLRPASPDRPGARVRATRLAIAAVLGCAAILASGAVVAQKAAPAKERHSGLGDLGSRKEPIKIDSDRLDVFDKEGRAVFSGNVIAVQGDSTMRCTTMTVLYEQGRGIAAAQAPDGAKGSGAAQAAEPARPAGGGLTAGDSSIRKINCKGPVTIVSKTQVATGDNAEFDRVANKVFLIGNAALSDGPNVTRGERVAYDLNSGVANVEGGRVRAVITPGSQKDGAKPR